MITIIINTYRRPDLLRRLIGQLATDSKHRLQVLIFNDDPDHPLTRGSLPVITANNSSSQMKIFNHCVNYGKAAYWVTWHEILWQLKNYKHGRYIIFLPDDVSLVDGFIDKAIDLWNGITDERKAVLNLLKCNRELAQWTPQVKMPGKVVSRVGWWDLCGITDHRLMEALDYIIKPVSTDRFKDDPYISSGVGSQISKRLFWKGCTMYQVNKGLVLHGRHKSQMNSAEREDNNLK